MRSPVTASLTAILAFRLVTREPARLVAFYTGLGFAAGEPQAIPAAEMTLLGLQGVGWRRTLSLGDQRIELDHFDPPGQPYPSNVTGADSRFQHLALVTDDAAAAWSRARALGAATISVGGPVTLPESSGGVTAVKFRDPEGHPLELLQFAGSPRKAGLLGIDHSAISVADVEASRAFYEALGLSTQGRMLNHGPTQAALDALAGAEVDVVPLMPAIGTPHLELLGYRSPSPRRAGHLAANDVAATRVVWSADRDGLLRDPDGHLHLLTRVDKGSPPG
ncbi:VOC family protein [Ramlibacter ginsenosidimutans]|uniref:VOC family protein n=1 Tax=Ramlibacter ginsenosidimutans TaxID=502333 RepID=A0A934WN64_9BURK|nr:VOC family protein [Ramlibacter ginsenosidimutans]MBK6007218.1 VOC family protein [Ramlibacter ginsenosidimutans]